MAVTYVNTTNIQRGQVIMQQEFKWYLLHETHKHVVCNYCLAVPQTRAALRKCGRCRNAYYCNETCQHADWAPRHKYECRHATVRKNAHGVMNVTETCLTLETMITDHALLNQDVRDMVGEVTDGLNSSVSGNGTARQQPRRGPGQLAPAFLTFYDWSGHSFDMYEVSPSLGLCVCTGISKYPHSCQPNAIAINEGKMMYMVALEPIDNLESVRLSHMAELRYITQPREERMQLLQALFSVECRCVRCAEGEGYDEHMYLLKCPAFCGGIASGLTAANFAQVAHDAQVARIARRVQCEACAARYSVPKMKEALLAVRLMLKLVGNYSRLSSRDIVCSIQPLIPFIAMYVHDSNQAVYEYLSVAVQAVLHQELLRYTCNGRHDAAVATTAACATTTTTLNPHSRTLTTAETLSLLYSLYDRMQRKLDGNSKITLGELIEAVGLKVMANPLLLRHANARQRRMLETVQTALESRLLSILPAATGTKLMENFASRTQKVKEKSASLPCTAP